MTSWPNTFDDAVQDTRYTLVTCRKNPGFAAIAVVALAIGIGANTAIFSVINAVLLRPLPYVDADQLVRIVAVSEANGASMPLAGVDAFELNALRSRTQTLSHVGVYQQVTMTLTGSGETAQLVGSQASADIFGMPVRPGLMVLAAAVACVLMIACANVANLLLSRMSARAREFVMRRALGATGGRLMRQVLTESIVLGIAGGAAGTALAFGAVRLLGILGSSLPRRDLAVGVNIPRLAEIGIDVPVFAFTLGVSVITGVLFGMAPALRQSRTVGTEALREATGSAGSGFNLFGRHRLQGVLVIVEIAMATLLFVGGGLLVRSFLNLSHVDPGYDPKNVLTFQVALPRGRPSAQFSRDLVDRLRRLIR